MSKILKININFGCSIILKYYYIFEQLLKNNIFERIYISLDKNILNYYRGENDNYYNNYQIFLKYISNNPNIIIEDIYNPKYKNICVTSLSNEFSIPIKFNLYNKLISGYNIYNFNYITISTKILGISKNIYNNNIKNDLIKLLKNVKCKIVILGERDIVSCREYKIHETYSIYYDLINNIDNFEDLTIKNNTINNELIPLLTSLDILNKSILNIYIGNSGISEIIPFVSNNILGFTHKEELLNTNNYLHEDKNNINIYNNYSDFLKKLENFNI